MSNGNPAEKGNAQPATSLAGSKAAACVGVGTNNGSGLDVEVDEYDELLAAMGRTEEQDERIAVHEAGHAVCARLLGHEVGGVTVNPDPVRGYEGLCWGVGHTEAFAEGRGDALDVRNILTSVMPQAGEDRTAVSDIYGSVYSQCIELMAGRAAERMLLDEEPTPPVDDLRQASELAMLICSTEEAIKTFVMHCDVAARDLLMPHGVVLMTLQLVLRIKRVLTGSEIDGVIADVRAFEALGIEHQRRADWRKSELAAARFHAECDPLDAARLPHFTADQVS